MDSETLAWTFAASIGLLATIQFTRTLYLKWYAQRRAKYRAARAIRGEREAEHLLMAHGYRILARQPRSKWTPLVNDRPYPLQLRGDLLVSRNRKRFIAEVKTGTLAPRLDHSPTRRQLLEYQLAFRVEGIVLVNMETETLSHIEFPTLARVSQKPTPALFYSLIGFVVGIGAMWWNPIRALFVTAARLTHLESALPR